MRARAQPAMEECIGASMFLRKFFDLPCQIAHRPEPHASFLRVKTVPVVSVALALRAASAGCTAMHPVGRDPHRWPLATGKGAHCGCWPRIGGLGARAAALQRCTPVHWCFGSSFALDSETAICSSVRCVSVLSFPTVGKPLPVGVLARLTDPRRLGEG